MTQAQHMSALERANEIRSAHAELLEQIRVRPRTSPAVPPSRRRGEGARRAAYVLERGRGPCERLRVDRLLEAVPRLGPNGTARFLRAAGVTLADKRIGELTDRQRSQLAEALRAWAEPEAVTAAA